MAESRYFKCYGCNHEWDLPYGTGQSGQQLKCPKCGGNNIHRTGAGEAGHGRGPSPEGRGRGGKDAAPGLLGNDTYNLDNREV